MSLPEHVEKAPWSLKITRNGAGLVSGVRVLAAEPRHVFVMYMQSETVTDRVGRKHLKPGTTPKVTTEDSAQPATVCTCGMATEPIEICDCGVAYVGLSSESLLAHGDLISAAPELYEALELLLGADVDADGQHAGTVEFAVSRGDDADVLQKCHAALAKARGQQNV